MRCTGKEQLTCNEEKMGCEGCYYNDDKNKDEIKVGEYVRMIDGLIARIVAKDKDNHFILNRYYAGGRYLTEIEVKNDIVKHSSNIIDLVEIGDYVNGMEVEIVYGYDEDGNDKDGLGICKTDDDYAYYKYLENIDIKSLVTKEQFQSVEFRLEE